MRIYVNQAGYLPNSVKTVILAENVKKQSSLGCMSDKVIRIFAQNSQNCILEKKAKYFGMDKDSGDFVWQADVSELTQEGYYEIREEEGAKANLRILKNIYQALNQVLCKAFYYQRCGIKLEEEYAGIFKRECCHTGKAVLLEDYLQMTDWKKSEKDIRWFDVTGGWHDAGDYGRYTTAAATALAHMLYAWKWFPESFQDELNIPESGNGVDDILNECLYELRWLLKMQMDDGSVRHKLTSMRHANFVMPDKDRRQMILFPESTISAGAFSAIMALASRIYRAIEPEFAATALEAAKRSWNWLESHPEFIGFHNPKGCNTGEYEDTDDRDERLWAACELYRCTGDEKYLEQTQALLAEIDDKTALGWTDVAGFAGWALLEEDMNGREATKGSCEIEEKLKEQYKDWILGEAQKVMKISKQSGYMAALESDDYGWGSNMVLLNQGMVLAEAYLLSRRKEFLECAGKQMDYLLGVNATGYSYVTGVGEHAIKNPHNRVTVADGIEDTIPGFVSGGANSCPVDEKAEWLIEPGTSPMKCFLDIWECYSLNEITIYWNSPAVFLAAFLNKNRVKEKK